MLGVVLLISGSGSYRANLRTEDWGFPNAQVPTLGLGCGASTAMYSASAITKLHFRKYFVDFRPIFVIESLVIPLDRMRDCMKRHLSIRSSRAKWIPQGIKRCLKAACRSEMERPSRGRLSSRRFRNQGERSGSPFH